MDFNIIDIILNGTSKMDDNFNFDFNVLINDNITNIMNNTTESVPTVKKRKRRSKKEIEQEELLKNLVPDSELNDD